MGKVTIEFYALPDGTEPAKEFILSLDKKMRAKIICSAQLLEANGWEVREPTSKYLGDGIFELRAQFGNNISRVLYFFFIGNKAVLTNGFIKKTQKTPQKEIDKAKRYKADYESREADRND